MLLKFYIINIYLFIFSNLVAKKFDNEVYLLAVSIPSKSSVEKVYECFEQLKTYNKQCIMGNYYLLLLIFSSFYNFN